MGYAGLWQLCGTCETTRRQSQSCRLVLVRSLGSHGQQVALAESKGAQACQRNVKRGSLPCECHRTSRFRSLCECGNAHSRVDRKASHCATQSNRSAETTGSRTSRCRSLEASDGCLPHCQFCPFDGCFRSLLGSRIYTL